MPDSQDYRSYLDERFKHLITLINANHKESMDSNDRVESLVNATNGRVLDLERQKIEYLKTRVDTNMLKNVEEHIKDLESVVRQNLPHTVIHCPQKENIDDIKTWKEQQEAKEAEIIHQESIKTRNWTKTIGIISVAIALAGMMIGMIKMKNDMDRQFQNLGVPVISIPRGETLPPGTTIKMWPNDFKNDSIK